MMADAMRTALEALDLQLDEPEIPGDEQQEDEDSGATDASEGEPAEADAAAVSDPAESDDPAVLRDLILQYRDQRYLDMRDILILHQVAGLQHKALSGRWGPFKSENTHFVRLAIGLLFDKRHFYRALFDDDPAKIQKAIADLNQAVEDLRINLARKARSQAGTEFSVPAADLKQIDELEQILFEAISYVHRKLQEAINGQ